MLSRNNRSAEVRQGSRVVHTLSVVVSSLSNLRFFLQLADGVVDVEQAYRSGLCACALSGCSAAGLVQGTDYPVDMLCPACFKLQLPEVFIVAILHCELAISCSPSTLSSPDI
jgi:hypothetical protein